MPKTYRKREIVKREGGGKKVGHFLSHSQDQTCKVRKSRIAAKFDHSNNEGPNLDSVVVCQVNSSSQFTINVQVGDVPVTAVVDTAAQVTIISDRVYKSLKHKPSKIRG